MANQNSYSGLHSAFTDHLPRDICKHIRNDQGSLSSSCLPLVWDVAVWPRTADKCFKSCFALQILLFHSTLSLPSLSSYSVLHDVPAAGAAKVFLVSLRQRPWHSVLLWLPVRSVCQRSQHSAVFGRAGCRICSQWPGPSKSHCGYYLGHCLLQGVQEIFKGWVHMSGSHVPAVHCCCCVARSFSFYTAWSVSECYLAGVLGCVDLRILLIGRLCLLACSCCCLSCPFTLLASIDW